MNKKYIGVDIGGTKCAVVLGNERGEVQSKIRFPTDQRAAPEQILEQICSAIAQCWTEDVVGIGVSCGGPLDSRTGTILSPPNLPRWDHVAIKDHLEARFSVPTRLQNDANACTIAEWKFGAGRGMQNVIFLTFGTGMGAGMVLNNRLYEGRNGNAGEIGHIRMEAAGPVGFGKIGSFEGFCSGGGIAQLARSFALSQMQSGNYPAYCRDAQSIPAVTAACVAEAAGAGDPTACHVYETVGRYLGKGLSVLMDVLNPEIIVLGSIYGRSGDLMKAAMDAEIAREALHACICPVVPALLGETIGDVGALCVGMEVC